MAIINSYPKDKDIQDKDAWIGTDSYNRQTRQYTAEAVAKYLNIKGRVSIAGQMNYQFVITPKIKVGTMAFAVGSGDGTLFSNITELVISASDLSGQNVVKFVDYLVDQEILISDQLNKDLFGHYKITSYIQDPVSPGFYNLAIEYIGGNGGIYADNFYNLVNFTFGGEPDKTFVFVQSAASAVWNIQHDLNKYPSATMVLSTGQVGMGDVTYIDENNLTITFAGAESGKAFIN